MTGLKTGRRITSGGYVAVWDPTHPLAMKDGYVLEHRKVAWDTGMMTDPSHEVHHGPGGKIDNRPSNLAVETPSSHQRHHSVPGTIRRNQHGVAIIGTGVNLRRLAKRAAAGRRACEWCGADITALRIDATVCGQQCRMARWKAKQSI